MSSSCAQSDVPGSTLLLNRGAGCPDGGYGGAFRLAVETALVTGGVLAAIRSLYATPMAGFQWLLIPGILVAAALLPTWVAGRQFPPFGFNLSHAKCTVRTVFAVCLCALPIVVFAFWIASRWRLPIPLRPVVTGRSGWLAWLLYQFLYVAVAEEIFFRGYVQANVMRFLRYRPKISSTRRKTVAILASAGCFALAHILVQGRAIALLTFLPGLLLAWLFVRTRSLLGPMLFHGLANVSYGIMALALN